MEIVVGAAVALLGAVVGTIALEWLTGRRLERHFARERFQKLRGLRAEMAENSVLDTGGDWRKAPFSTDAWEEAKGILAEWSRRSRRPSGKHTCGCALTMPSLTTTERPWSPAVVALMLTYGNPRVVW